MTAANLAPTSRATAGGLRWERLLSGEGGDVLDLQFGERNEIIAVTPLGLFRSDGGEHWTRIESPPLVRTLHRAASWWLGTDFGLFRADHLGRSWQPVMSGVAVTAVSAGELSDVVLAATFEEGLLRSDDGGNTWEDANPGLPGDDIIAIHRSPTFERDRTIFVATESGLFRSRNEGRAWRQVGPDTEDIQCFTVIENQLLVGTVGDGLWTSPDLGRTWYQSLPGTEILEFGASSAGRGIVLSELGLLAIDANGEESSRLPLPPDALCAIEAGAFTLIGTLGRGVHRLMPGGEGWATASIGLEATARDRVLTIGQSRLVTTSGRGNILHSDDGGASWSELPDKPRESILDFDARVDEKDSLEIAACDGRFVSIYGGVWQQLEVEPALAVTWVGGEPGVLTADGRFACGEIRARVIPERFKFTGARLLRVPGQSALLWAVLHTDNSGVFVLRSSDSGRSWELLLQTDTTGAVSLAAMIDVAGNEVALLAVHNQVYRPLESPEPVWIADAGAISAIAVHPDEGVLLATSRGLVVASPDFAALEFVAGSPAPLLDVSFEKGGDAIALERGGSIWRFSRPREA